MEPFVVSHAKLIRLASYASVGVAMSLVVMKLYAWWVTGSVGVLASLLDSAFDLIASLMIVLAIHIAQIPADKEHRFGHGKAEPLAALAQSVFIAGSAVYLVIYAVERLWLGQVLVEPEIGMSIMLLSLSLTLGLVSFQRYVARKTQSLAIQSDSLHYLSDISANLLVIVGLWLSQYAWLDPVLAVLIAFWILRSAFKIARKAGNQLLDHELPDTMRQQILQIVLSTPEVRGVNDLRTYRSGPNQFVQFDLELDDELTLRQAHQITERVTERLQQAFDNLDVMVHQEPVSLKNDPKHHPWGRE